LNVWYGTNRMCSEKNVGLCHVGTYLGPNSWCNLIYPITVDTFHSDCCLVGSGSMLNC
jgi:hypothetical protein